jgi:hypothetical protein
MSVSNPATFNPAGVVSTNSAGIVTTAASANYQASPDMFSDGLMATPIHAFGGTDSNIDAAAGKFVSRQTGGKKRKRTHKRKAMRKQRKTANKRSRVAKKTKGKKSKRARGKKSKRVRFL